MADRDLYRLIDIDTVYDLVGLSDELVFGLMNEFEFPIATLNTREGFAGWSARCWLGYRSTLISATLN